MVKVPIQKNFCENPNAETMKLYESDYTIIKSVNTTFINQVNHMIYVNIQLCYCLCDVFNIL